MSHFKAKMHQIQFRLGLCPRPQWGSLQHSPDPLAGFKGPTSMGRDGRGGRGEGEKAGERGGEGREMERGERGKRREGRKKEGEGSRGRRQGKGAPLLKS